jgi:hypothetical protein
MRVRVWYSIVYLEATLCLVTGRPSGLQEQDSSGPVPQSSLVGNGQGPDVYYLALMRISMIAAMVQGQLYSARTLSVRRSQASAEKKIANLAHKIDAWKQMLPDVLAFDSDIADENFARQVRPML